MNIYENTSYKVYLNRKPGFTITYEDDCGQLLFVFDIRRDPKAMLLDARPSEGGRMVEARDEETRVRINLAIERIKAHFKATGGWNVETYTPKPLSPEENAKIIARVTALIQNHVGWNVEKQPVGSGATHQIVFTRKKPE